MLGLETIKYSLKNLSSRKSRSILTILSIFIGIATIFLFISFGLGLRSYVDTIASQSGVDKFVVQAKGIGAPGTSPIRLEDKDYDTILKVPGVKTVFAMYLKPIEVKQNNQKLIIYGVGFSPTQVNNKLMREMYSIKVLSGRELKKGDKSKVLLGYNYQLPKKIFDKPLRVGDKLELNGKTFDVIGFYESTGNPQDDANVYLTDDAMKNLFSDEKLSYAIFIGQVSVKEKLNEITATVEKELRKERDQEKGKEDFYVQTYEQLIEQFSSALDIVTGFVILIALISVIVSAVNTANTMVTSVLERTKEIGVMKAIGAKSSTIRNIFLFESSVLGFVAGVFGVIFGYMLSSLAKAILVALGWSFLAPKVTGTLFVGLIIFATLVGTISGVSVAIQASKQNAVDALRYE